MSDFDLDIKTGAVDETVQPDSTSWLCGIGLTVLISCGMCDVSAQCPSSDTSPFYS